MNRRDALKLACNVNAFYHSKNTPSVPPPLIVNQWSYGLVLADSYFILHFTDDHFFVCRYFYFRLRYGCCNTFFSYLNENLSTEAFLALKTEAGGGVVALLKLFWYYNSTKRRVTWELDAVLWKWPWTQEGGGVAATGISLSTPQRRYFPCIQVDFGRRSRLSIYFILTGVVTLYSMDALLWKWTQGGWRRSRHDQYV